MRRLIALVVVALVMAAMMLTMAMPTFAATERSGLNCAANIFKQEARGQIGSLTGSPNDSKLLPVAVTNCDHFWN